MKKNKDNLMRNISIAMTGCILINVGIQDNTAAELFKHLIEKLKEEGININDSMMYKAYTNLPILMKKELEKLFMEVSPIASYFYTIIKKLSEDINEKNNGKRRDRNQGRDFEVKMQGMVVSSDSKKT